MDVVDDLADRGFQDLYQQRALGVIRLGKVVRPAVLHHVFDLRHAVEKRIVGVCVEMDELHILILVLCLQRSN